MLKFDRTQSVYKLSQQAFSVLVLAGIFSTGASSLLTALAAPNPAFPASATELKDRPTRDSRLPGRLSNIVRRDLARRQNIPPGRVRVTSSTPTTWNNGCLDLPAPDEVCTLAQVEGWRIQLTDGRQTWVYRTNATGTVLRLEGQTTPPDDRPGSSTLPQSIADIVLRTASRESGLPVSRLQIAQAEQRTWDGCLGIYVERIACTEIAIFGWRVVVTDGQQRWVYHTNADGSDVRFNPVDSQASSSSTITPVQIPATSLPAPLEGGVLFRAIASGGFAGITTTTTLYDDGRVIQQRMGSTQTQTFTVPRQQLQQFRQMLEQQRFEQFDRLSYPAGSGSADYFTVTLIGRSGTTQYADIVQDQLPAALQQVIRSWNAIVVDR